MKPKALIVGAISAAFALSFDAKGDNKAPGFVVYAWKGGAYDYAGK
ncbi:MAG: hypothetical protein AB1768_09545 [Pseudomonadota bacterium]|jgi:branched-chain amino acid transport system substrate-binding protein